jgi:two-component system sensor histidine kinase KdpD
MLIRRGKRVADYLRADCFAVYISETGDLRSLPVIERDTIERHLNFARSLQIETRILQAEQPASTLVDFARRERITQIFVARPKIRSSKFFRSQSMISQMLRLAQDMQVTVVAERGPK